MSPEAWKAFEQWINEFDRNRRTFADVWEAGMDYQRKVDDSKRLVWFDLHGVAVDTVADERGGIRVRWHRGDAFGGTLREAIDIAILQQKILDDPDDEPSAGNGDGCL